MKCWTLSKVLSIQTKLLPNNAYSTVRISLSTVTNLYLVRRGRKRRRLSNKLYLVRRRKRKRWRRRRRKRLSNENMIR